MAEVVCGHCRLRVSAGVCPECGYVNRKKRKPDARDLVAQLLQDVEPEPYEEDWQAARIEAAVRRVILSLGNRASSIVKEQQP